jgi:hypothetical protein
MTPQERREKIEELLSHADALLSDESHQSASKWHRSRDRHAPSHTSAIDAVRKARREVAALPPVSELKELHQ